jgi:hypothetical protein
MAAMAAAMSGTAMMAAMAGTITIGRTMTAIIAATTTAIMTATITAGEITTTDGRPLNRLRALFAYEKHSGKAKQKKHDDGSHAPLLAAAPCRERAHRQRRQERSRSSRQCI